MSPYPWDKDSNVTWFGLWKVKSHDISHFEQKPKICLCGLALCPLCEHLPSAMRTTWPTCWMFLQPGLWNEGAYRGWSSSESSWVQKSGSWPHRHVTWPGINVSGFKSLRIWDCLFLQQRLTDTLVLDHQIPQVKGPYLFFMVCPHTQNNALKVWAANKHVHKRIRFTLSTVVWLEVWNSS